MRVFLRSLAVLAVICLASLTLVLRRWSIEQAQRVAQRCAKRILRIAGVTVEQQGQVAEEPCLVVCNHRSYIDILTLLSAAPSGFLCKREVGRWPLVGAIATRVGVVFVDRESKRSRRESLDRVAEAVLAGRTITAFPEGTTTRPPAMRETRPGLFAAAARHGFSVVPAVIEYADPHDAWVGDDTLVRHCSFWLSKPGGRVTLRFGRPLRCGTPGCSDLRVQTETWMRSALNELNRAFQAE